MKKRMLGILVVVGTFYSICGSSMAKSQDPVQSDGKTNMPLPQYSQLAAELIEAYKYPKQAPNTWRPIVAMIPPLLPKHLDAKYRPAWEELLRVLVVRSTCDMRVIRMESRIFEAFGHMKAPESIPALAEAFKQITGQNIKQIATIRIQEDVLVALVAICDTNSLGAILASLDLAEKSYVNKEPERTSDGMTLREKTLRIMLQSDITIGKSDFQRDAIESANKWKALIDGYQRPDLSQKNREFLDKVKAFKRSTDEK
jgi:hypothetical protein